ncbi:putative RNA-directed DNA polymerase from transposon X-element [Trichonephila clavipes]|nr:putative RNA-directed DNA polymerase from transposon X-element [Trichonephila clavipes]
MFKCRNCDDKSHHALLCNKKEEFDLKNETVEATISNSFASQSLITSVYLQTVALKLCYNNSEMVLRYLLDDGSQRSYLTRRVIDHLNLKPVLKQTIVHGLFVGRETAPRKHSIYKVIIKSIDDGFSCQIKVFSENKICGYLPKVKDLQVLSEIKEKGIIVLDLCNSVNEIDMLLGADVISVILSGRSIKLRSGMMAIGTMLGFTLMGKSSQEVNDNTEVSVPAIRERQLSMFLNQLNVKELWDLETIGIRDPVENIKKKVTETEIQTDAYYFPHRAVFKSSDTTKIRPVFDATAREENNPSLNDCLLIGPNLIELIPDILDRFRMYPIALSANIEKAFLQISVTPEHRDFLRFFYPHENNEIVYRHCRLVFGVCSIPFLLAASINHLLDNTPSKYMNIVYKLRRSFYVDNCVTGVSDTQEIGSFVNKVRKIMSNGCFSLRGWESNVKKESISKCEGETKVLGLTCNLDRDTLRCTVNNAILEKLTEMTKRTILSAVQGIFDPLGILTAATLLPKRWLQETWKVKLSWDSSLPLGLYSDLHVFVDASKEDYAACIFVRTKLASEIKLHLLRAKARVAPTKSVSMPRLELLACCVGAGLANSIRNSLDIPDLKITYWSDFMIALHWIKNNGEWSIFVSNRIKEIARISSPENWRHVPGRMNPADVLSRGCSPRHLLESKWFGGPEWLLGDAVTWPTNELQCETKVLDWNAVLTYEELLTVLCNCEAIVNCRPLTYVSEDSDDLIPLTPAMFMMNNASLDVTDLDLSDFARFQKRSAEMEESNDVPLDAEALKIPSAGVDVSESAIPVNAPPNMPKVSRYGRTIQRRRRLNVFNVTTVFESE